MALISWYTGQCYVSTGNNGTQVSSSDVSGDTHRLLLSHSFQTHSTDYQLLSSLINRCGVNLLWPWMVQMLRLSAPKKKKKVPEIRIKNRHSFCANWTSQVPTWDVCSSSTTMTGWPPCCSSPWLVFLGLHWRPAGRLFDEIQTPGWLQAVSDASSGHISFRNISISTWQRQSIRRIRYTNLLFSQTWFRMVPSHIEKMFVGTGLLQGVKDLDDPVAGVLVANKVYERIWKKRLFRRTHIVCLCISRPRWLRYLVYCPGASVGPVPLLRTVGCLFGPSCVGQASHRASRRLWRRWCSLLASVHRWTCWPCPGFVWNKAEWKGGVKLKLPWLPRSSSHDSE